jgi:hypothetical protein
LGESGLSEAIGAVFSLVRMPVENDEWERMSQRSGSDANISTIFKGLAITIQIFEGLRRTGFELRLVKDCFRFSGGDIAIWVATTVDGFRLFAVNGNGILEEACHIAKQFPRSSEPAAH